MQRDGNALTKALRFLPSAPWSATLVKLYITLNDTDTDLQAFMRVVENAAQLKTLGFSASYMKAIDGRIIYECGVGEMILRDLFSHVSRSGVLHPLLVDRLELHYISMLCSQPAAFWQVIDFTRLKELALLSCPGLESCLSALTSLFQRTDPSLTRLVLLGSCIGEDILESFLQSFVGLQSLSINTMSVNNKLNLPVDGIIRHGRTLKKLEVCYYSANFTSLLSIANNDLQRIVNDCQNLVHFTAPMPWVSMERAKTGCWSSFGEAIACLSRLSRLLFLNLVHWPYSQAKHKDVLALYLMEVDEFATNVMQYMDSERDASNLASSRPPILMFGCPGYIRNSDDVPAGLKEVCYIPAIQTNVFNQNFRVAIREHPHRLRFIEPAATI